MKECKTGITITQTVEECSGNYTSTNCISTPNAITYLDLSAGASQTQINANLVSALMRKDEQISEIPIANGSETKIVAGTNVTVTGTGTNLSNYVISATGNYSQKIIPQTQGIYNIIIEDNNKGLVFENLSDEDGLEITIQLPLGLPDGFRTKVLKKDFGLVRILPEIRILKPGGKTNTIATRYDWVYIEKLNQTDNFIINGSLTAGV